jgi:hypothetical protein
MEGKRLYFADLGSVLIRSGIPDPQKPERYTAPHSPPPCVFTLIPVNIYHSVARN